MSSMRNRKMERLGVARFEPPDASAIEVVVAGHKSPKPKLGCLFS